MVSWCCFNLICSLTVQEIVDTELLDKKYNDEEAKVGHFSQFFKQLSETVNWKLFNLPHCTTNKMILSLCNWYMYLLSPSFYKQDAITFAYPLSQSPPLSGVDMNEKKTHYPLFCVSNQVSFLYTKIKFSQVSRPSNYLSMSHMR